MKISLFWVLIFGFLAFKSEAQRKFPAHPENPTPTFERHKNNAILFHVTYAAHFPSGVLADRFGFCNAIGSGLEFMPKNNLVAGADFYYLYGKDVKEDPLTPVRTDSGYILGVGPSFGSVVLRQRGFYFGGHIGKMFPFGRKNRAGLRVTIGAGVLHHKIRVQDDSRSVPQFSGDYLAGYDRLTGGLALNQFIGYQMLSRSRTINFFIGLEFNEAFTRSLREYDYASMKKLEGNRFDFQYGIRAGWTLPFYIGNADKIYY